MIFTEEQIREIRSRLAQIGIKDTDLPSADEVNGGETIAIVQEGLNKKILLSQVFESPAFSSFYKLLMDTIEQKCEELDTLIEDIKESKLSLSDQFGDSTAVGITQKTLTESINNIWAKLRDITGDDARELVMTITPPYFISNEGADVHIKATCKDANKVFEKVSLYLNGELLTEAENVESIDYDTHIDEESTIKCTAQIMGKEYSVEDTIKRYSNFFVGAGKVFTSIMDAEHSVEIGKHKSINITCEDGDNIYVVIGEELASEFIRLDMNGFEIPFLEGERTVVIDGVKYYIYISSNTYKAGTYNIDINS